VGAFAASIAALFSAALSLTLFRNSLDWVLAYAFVSFFGGAVGAAELISRYKDSPTRALRTGPAMFYIVLNALGSAAALYLISINPSAVGLVDAAGKWIDDTKTLVQAVLIAGFGSLLFFRTSIFKVRVGDADMAIGPSIVLDTLLNAADRAVDRVMAEPRAIFVHGLMSDISFEKAAIILPSHCISLMQNVSSEESQRIVSKVNALRAEKETPDKIKALNLGLSLLSIVGEKVLRTAVESLRKELQDSTAKLLEEVGSVMRQVSFERARRMLPPYCFALWAGLIPDELQQKLQADFKALSELSDVPEDYKSLFLGIRLARLTDGATLRKAVEDLGTAIKVLPRLQPPADDEKAAN
jgi:hypothetical protein